MATYPIRSRLPTAYNTAIGRIVTRQAVLEGALRRCIYTLLDLNQKFGRVAVKSPRADDSFTMIHDLMRLRGFETTVDTKGLRTDCRHLEEFRDKVAHGIWVKHTDSKGPILQVTAGSYQRTPGGESVKARIDPQAFNVSQTAFAGYAKGINDAIRMVQKLHKELQRQLFAWRKTQHEQ